VTRRAWILVVIAYVILALGFLATTAWLSHQQDDLEKKSEQIERNQKAIAVTSRDLKNTQVHLNQNDKALLRLLSNTAAAICLEAFAKEENEAALVRRFNRTGEIDLTNNPTCRKAVKIGANLVLKGGP
jgi:Flp pilus assembly protein CpaB